MRFIFLLFLVVAVLVSCEAVCVCTADYSPVCGTNGRTYSNGCRMNCEGATFHHLGPCLRL